MNIESMYLIIYYKKNKQRFLVLPRSETLEWLAENHDKIYATFRLEQVEFTNADWS